MDNCLFVRSIIDFSIFLQNGSPILLKFALLFHGLRVVLFRVIHGFYPLFVQRTVEWSPWNRSMEIRACGQTTFDT
ncbi:hypothetical protein [Enterococcus avium]|uniref:hypothetical protein n=1 Tax=Enterococcus TaxID=1350 RepID=UPI001CED121C|nr:hypothetical protein [Enterococcus avium]